MFKVFSLKRPVILEIDPKVVATSSHHSTSYLVDSGLSDINRVLEKYSFTTTESLSHLDVTGFDDVFTELKGTVLTNAAGSELDISTCEFLSKDLLEVAGAVREAIIAGKGIILGTVYGVTSNLQSPCQSIARPIYAINRSQDGSFMSLALIKDYIADEWGKAFNLPAAVKEPLSPLVNRSNAETVPNVVAVDTAKSVEVMPAEHYMSAPIIAPVTVKSTANPKPPLFHSFNDYLVKGKRRIVVMSLLPVLIIAAVAGTATLLKDKTDTSSNNQTSSQDSGNLFKGAGGEKAANNIQPVAAPSTDGYGFKDQNNNSYNNGVMSAEQMAALQIKTSEDYLKSMNIDVNDNSDLGCFTDEDTVKAAAPASHATAKSPG